MATAAEHRDQAEILDIEALRDYYRHLRSGLPGDPPAWPSG